ncbi:MAG: hypothetical protein KatS3mg076_0632 [Candidatus Binatia bacterium]|nr:MAG: hypothetical protein KatS3mg076_0632 [Candidatus Binatia bacterium]
MRGRRVLFLYPGALGDFLCFLPALLGFREKRPDAEILLVARSEWLSLLRDEAIETHDLDSREVAELYSPEPPWVPRKLLEGVDEVHSWSGRGDADFLRCLSESGGRRRARVYSFRAFAAGEHAVDYYARCLGVEPKPVFLSPREEERRWVAGWLDRQKLGGKPLLALHPGSGSKRKNWEGFPALARWWEAKGGAVVWLVGPAEDGLYFPEGAVLFRQELPRVVALLERASFYAGNDSGITHLAAAAGCRGLALFPEESFPSWSPRSPLFRTVVARRDGTCGCRVLCRHGLPEERVLDEAEAWWRMAQT